MSEGLGSNFVDDVANFFSKLALKNLQQFKPIQKI
jgi:hypothetical protein